MSIADGKDERGLQDLIRSAWDALASYAWKEYQKQGRGAVMMDFTLKDFRQGQVPFVSGAVPFGMGYVSESDSSVKAEGWGDEHFEGMVKRYDPETQIVVACVFKGTKITFIRCGTPIGHKTPRQLVDANYQAPKMTPEMLGMGRN